MIDHVDARYGWYFQPVYADENKTKCVGVFVVVSDRLTYRVKWFDAAQIDEMTGSQVIAETREHGDFMDRAEGHVYDDKLTFV